MVSMEFFTDIILPAAIWPGGVDSDSKRNENLGYFLRGKDGLSLGLTILPLSYKDCLEI